MLTEKGSGWVGYSRRPTSDQVDTEIQTLCALYAPKMIYNAGHCAESTAFLDDMMVLLKPPKDTGMDGPSKLAHYFLTRGGVFLLDEPPSVSSGTRKITAQVFRNRHGVPVIQTHFGSNVGPSQCVASIALLWAWALQQVGETGAERLSHALGLVPYYHQEHSAEHGGYRELGGFMAGTAYVTNMLSLLQCAGGTAAQSESTA